MGYGRSLRGHRHADVRVLKAQLDLIVGFVRSSQVHAPLFALAIAFAGSGQFGYFGHASFRAALILPFVVAMVGLLCLRGVKSYQRDIAHNAQADRLEAWFPRFLAMQIAVSAGWGLTPWLLWDSGNALNHVFLAGCVCGILAELMMSRANQMDILIASVIPLAAISSLRFLLGGTPLDLAIAAGLPIFGLQFFLAARELTRRLDKESRLRFEVEDMARDLEVARDEALRKRFEAETANASKTVFLANMSHELRTPLNAILGFSEIIATECFGPVGSPRYREYAGDIHSSGTHLLSLINDLLDVAKIESGKMEIEAQAVDVPRMFEIALKIIGGKARERGQRLVMEVKASAPSLFADERALKQILINLLSNAVKFTPEGGHITVTGSRSQCGNFLIVVEDDGPGIPREKIDRVFKPFSQVDNRYDRTGGGTGLGLALVRGLAELHGGRAWLESEPGMGCRACVILPSKPDARITKLPNSRDGAAMSAVA